MNIWKKLGTTTERAWGSFEKLLLGRNWGIRPSRIWHVMIRDMLSFGRFEERTEVLECYFYADPRSAVHHRIRRETASGKAGARWMKKRELRNIIGKINRSWWPVSWEVEIYTKGERGIEMTPESGLGDWMHGGLLTDIWSTSTTDNVMQV